MTLNDILLKLSAIPRERVIGAYKALGNSIPESGISRVDLNNAVAHAVDRGLISLSQVAQGFGASKPAPAPKQTPVPPVSATHDSRLTSMQAQIGQIGSDLNNEVAAINVRINQASAAAHQASTAATKAADATVTLSQRIGTVESSLLATREAVLKQGAEVMQAVEEMGKTRIDPALIETRLGELISAAFRPFEQAVRDAGAEAVVAAAASAKPVARKPAQEVFGVEVLDVHGDPVLVDCYDHPDAPAVDPHHVWTAEVLAVLLMAQDMGVNVWMGGEKGTGKTQSAQQFAARTGRNFVRVNFHKDSTTEDYCGGRGLTEGNTVFEPGPFLLGYETPGTVVLLDEPSNAHPGELATLNGFLEPGARVNYGDAIRRRAPGVLVFAADNTLGSGDPSGRYFGTKEMNSSLIDRFGLMQRFTHMPRQQEVEAVRRHTGAPVALVEHVVDLIAACRAKATSGEIIDAPSIRSVMAFIMALRRLPVVQAWDCAVAARQPEESAAGIDAIVTAHLDPVKIARLVKGWK